MGSPEDTSNFINAVISEKAFDSISSYIDYAKNNDDAKIKSCLYVTVFFVKHVLFEGETAL